MNKQTFRVIFSKVSATFIAVAEITRSHGQGKSVSIAVTAAKFFGKILMRLSLRAILIGAMFGHVTLVHAQMVAYKNGGGQQTVVDHAGNGRTVVQIVAPNSSGLSHNKFEQFNVDSNGVILNNSASNVLTRLAGYVEGNPNLKSKRAAGVILNEMTGVTQSQLNGYIEVAGQRADVIIANPNGITVGGGAGFVNTTRGVLTTGTPTFGADGSLSGFHVTRGEIAIGSGGLNATGVNQIDLIARSVSLNDSIWANRLNIVAGSNQVNFDDLGVQVLTPAGGQAAVGIDSSTLGGMYAQKIILIGTEAGVGVRTLGSIAASSGDITIDSHGKIVLNGNTNATGRVDLRSADAINNAGAVYAQQSVTLNGAGQVNNSGTLAAAGDVSVRAASFNSSGILAAGVDSTGKTSKPGSINLSSTGAVIANGRQTAGARFDVSAAAIDMSNATTSAGGGITLNASSGSINHSNATLQSGATFAANSVGDLHNDGGSIVATQLTIQAAALSNVGGSLTQTGNAKSAMQISGIFDNSHGIFQTNGIDAQIYVGMLNNQNGVLQADQALHLKSGDLDNSAGRIISTNGAGLTIDATGQILNQSGATVTGEQGGMIGGNGDVNLSGQRIINHASIRAGKDLRTATQQLDNNGGSFVAAGEMHGEIANLNNQNGILDAGAIDISADVLNNESGKIGADRLRLSGTTLLNQHGRIVQYGHSDVVIDMNRNIDNSHGQIQINGANLSMQAAELDNVSGSIAHAGIGAMTLKLSSDLDNQSGSIGSNGMFQLDAFSINNKSGKIFGADASHIAAAGAINNSSDGFIGSSDQINLSATTLDNRGGNLYGQHNLQLRADDALNNSGGSIQSDGTLSLAAGKEINNQAGRIEANGATNGMSLEMNSNSINNSKGRIASSAGGLVSITGRSGIANTEGIIGGNGRVDLTSNSVANRQGQLIAATDMNLLVGGNFENVQGSVFAGKNLVMRQTNASIDNSLGTISSSGDMTLAVRSINNHQGQINHSNQALRGASMTLQTGGAIANGSGSISSSNDLTLRAQTVTGDGRIVGGNNTTVALQGNYTNSAAALFSSNGTLRFSVTGDLVNNGTFSAYNGLMLEANNFTNSYGALVNSFLTSIKTQSGLTNQGRIYGDFISLAAGNLLNDENAVIAARTDLQFGARTITNRNHGLVTSLGGIAIGAALDPSGLAVGRADLVTNSQATIDSGADFVINAATFNNLNPTFATETVQVGTRQVIQFAFNAPTLEWMAGGSSPRCDQGGAGFACLVNNGQYWVLTTPNGRRSNDYWHKIYTETKYEERVIATDPGQIYASGNIFMNVDTVNNQASVIVAELGLGGTGRNLYNATQQGNVVYVNHGERPGSGSNGNIGIYTEGMVHHNSNKKKDNWPFYAGINEVIPGQTLALSIWPGDLPSRISNPAQGIHAGTNQLNTGTTNQIDKYDNNMRGDALSVDAAQGSAGQVKQIGGGSQTVALPGAAIPNLTLPSNQLFVIQPKPGTSYLVETDPAFTNYAKFISSDYMLSRLLINPQMTQLRLGDGYYEQKLIGDQLLQLKGRRLLNGYSNAEEQFRALMLSGTNVAQEMQLSVGVALSAEQMAALTSDIVWLVSQRVTLPDGNRTDVLVPVVYLAQLNASDVRPTGAIINGSDINLAYNGDVRNSGTIQGNISLIVNAKNIGSSGNLMVSSTEGMMILAAERDVNSTGAIAGNRIGIIAGNDINIASTTKTNDTATSSNTTITKLATINTGQLSMQAGHDINLTGAQINNSGVTFAHADNDLNLKTVNVGSSAKLDAGSSGHYYVGQSQDVGTVFQTGGEVTLAAGHDLNVKAAYANAGGKITLFAEHDVNVSTGVQKFSSDIEEHSTSRGFLSSTATDLRNQSSGVLSIGSTFSGDGVQLYAGHDANITGSNLVASHDVDIGAGNKVSITASENSYSQSSYQHQSKSGLFGSGGVGITYGNQSQTDTYQQSAVVHQGSVIGSLSGEITIHAKNQIEVVGSDIVAKTDPIFLAPNINIGSVQNEFMQSEHHEFKQSGVTLSIGSPTVNAATGMAQNLNRATQVDDPRLKKLYATDVGMTGLANYDTAVAELKQIKNGDKGSLSINLSVGSSNSESHSTTHISQAQGSNIIGGGKIKMVAIGDPNDASKGNITVTGSNLMSAQPAEIVATNDVRFQSAQNTIDTISTSSSTGWSAGVGFSLGKQTGITASATGFQSNANTNGRAVQQVDTQINSGGAMTLISGHDVSLSGAQIHANGIIGNIAHDLTVTSQQDTQSFQSLQHGVSGGVSYTFGVGASSASVSANQSKTKADYASVNQQSGIFAGAGGYDIKVGNHTQLDGGIISSTAAADQNQLSTQSLSYTDIVNHKQVDSSANGLSAGTGSAIYSVGKAAAGAVLANADQSGNATSLTKATITPGNVEVRNGDTDALNSINRDIATAHMSLMHDDVQHIAQAVQNDSEAGQVIFNTLATAADKAHYVMFDDETKKNQTYLVVCRQEPCTYDQKLNTNPNRELDDKKPNVQMVHISQDEIKNLSPDERAGIVVATNGILNDTQRAGELALQNADAISSRVAKDAGGNTKPTIILVTSPHTGNFVSELMVAGYEKFFSGFGNTNPDLNLAETFRNVDLDSATALSHSRGTLVTNNALQILIDEGAHSDTAKFELKGPALMESTIVNTVSKLRQDDDMKSRNKPEYSSFGNDPVATIIGWSPNFQLFSSLTEIYRMVTTDNSAHSCYGTGTAGCAKIEKPYAYADVTPAELQKIRQAKIDDLLDTKKNDLYKPGKVVDPAYGLLPEPIYFSKIPNWQTNAPGLIAPESNVRRLQELREFQSQTQGEK